MLASSSKAVTSSGAYFHWLGCSLPVSNNQAPMGVHVCKGTGCPHLYPLKRSPVSLQTLSFVDPSHAIYSTHTSGTAFAAVHQPLLLCGHTG